MEEAVQLVREWCAARPIDGLTVDVHRIPGRTPLIVAEVPASDPALADRTVLLYGHLDKQPEMTGWRDGLGPWTPVIEGDRLYGRGGADDGYAAFAALLGDRGRPGARPRPRPARRADRGQRGVRQPRPARPPRAPRDVIGRPDLVICLDSWAADTERLWVTTSLRGLVGGDADRRGAHRGRPLRVGQRHRAVELPDHPPAPRPRRGRRTGEVLLAEAHVEIPADRLAEADGDGRRARARSPSCSRSPGRPGRCPTTPSSRSSPAPGGRR